jgi:hypothetical protein
MFRSPPDARYTARMPGTATVLRHLLTLATLAGVAACTPAVAPPTTSQPAVAGNGTIMSVRPIQRRSAVDPVRAALLTDAGTSEKASGPLVEFIVLADDGAILSIVQANDAGFSQGDRVVIQRGAQTRLARP